MTSRAMVQAADIVFEIAADLHLDVVEAGIDRFLAKPAQLFLVIAEPSGRCGVAGIALRLERGDALGLARFGSLSEWLPPHRGSAHRSCSDNRRYRRFLGRHLGDHPPDRLAGCVEQADPRPH
jgi:hypothetical protein